MPEGRKSMEGSRASAFRSARRTALGLAALAAAWEIVVRAAGVRPDLLPTPSRILWEAWGDRANLGLQAWVTLSEVGGGMILALAVSLGAAVAAGLASGFCRGAALVTRAACSMPLPAVAPIALVWFGYGRTPKVLVAAFLGSLWVAARWVDGIHRVQGPRIDLMRSMGAGRLRLLWLLKLPATVPALMSGLRAGTANALIGVVIGEFVAGDTGLGPTVVSALFRMNTPQLAAALAILLALGLLLQIALKSLETLALRRLGSGRRA